MIDPLTYISIGEEEKKSKGDTCGEGQVGK